MNEIRFPVIEQGVIKAISNQDNLTAVMVGSPTAESLQKEDGKHSTIFSNEDKSYEAKELLNETLLDAGQGGDGAGYQKEYSTLLKKKRSRTPKEIILDMDYLRSAILTKDKEGLAKQKLVTAMLRTDLSRKRAIYGRGAKRSTRKAPGSNKQCHICNNKSTFTELKSCSIKSCSLLFCFNCLIKYKETEDSQLENSIYNNNWKCLKCRNICKCHRCRVSHKKGDKAILDHIVIPKEPISLKEIIQVSDLMNTQMRQMNSIVIDNVTIKEIGPDLEADMSYYYQSKEDEDNGQKATSLSNREIQKMKDIQQLCEVYNIRKYDAMLAKEKSNVFVLCIRCLAYDGNPNEFLCFMNKKDLMFYFKYCFFYLSKILRVNLKAFAKNKRDLLGLNQNAFLSKWKFYQPKVMCKSCFMCMMNMNYLSDNLKIIFNDDNIIPLPSLPAKDSECIKVKIEIASEKKEKRKYTKKKMKNSQDKEGTNKDNASTQKKPQEDSIEINAKAKEYNSNVLIGDSNTLFIKKSILNISLEQEVASSKAKGPEPAIFNSNNELFEAKHKEPSKDFPLQYVQKKETIPNEDFTGQNFVSTTTAEAWDYTLFLKYIVNQMSAFKVFMSEAKQELFISPNNNFISELDRKFQHFFFILNQIQSSIAELYSRVIALKNNLNFGFYFQGISMQVRFDALQKMNQTELWCQDNMKSLKDCWSYMNKLKTEYNEAIKLNTWCYYESKKLPSQ